MASLAPKRYKKFKVLEESQTRYSIELNYRDALLLFSLYTFLMIFAALGITLTLLDPSVWVENPFAAGSIPAFMILLIIGIVRISVKLTIVTVDRAAGNVVVKDLKWYARGSKTFLLASVKGFLFKEEEVKAGDLSYKFQLLSIVFKDGKKKLIYKTMAWREAREIQALLMEHAGLGRIVRWRGLPYLATRADTHPQVYLPHAGQLTLDLSNQGISDMGEIEDLAMATDIECLVLSDNRISEIKNLDNMVQLRTLYLNSNRIEHVKGLENLRNLQVLELANNRITGITGLDNLVSLRWLRLQKNEITSMRGLENLHNMEVLHLDNNGITAIEGLSSMAKLWSLSLFGNPLSGITGLSGLVNMRKLYLGNTGIQDIQGLDDLVNLELLGLEKNRIVELRGLQNLGRLKYLYLHGNPVNAWATEKFGGATRDESGEPCFVDPRALVKYCRQDEVT